MGLFWPLDNPSHVARLVGLVSAVAGCCALADRDTRYTLLHVLYTTLKTMDETAARDIEAAIDEITDSQQPPKHESDHTMGTNNARDTRSYASDSTAFSRAPSPPSPVASPTLQEREQSAGGPAFITPEDTRPSSALDSTPESVSQLGEALSRWKSAQRLYTPSPLSQDSSMPPLAGDNLPVQGAAVADAPRGDEVLLPLTTALATPESTNPQTPQEPKDASKRLSPLPNPKAPKIEPAVRDGRPQLFDYTPPQPATPPQPMPQQPTRRDRGHVEIETTEHESYGFVSNPSALVVPSIGPSDVVAADNGDHYLFVCIKCNRQSTNDVCEKICSDEDGVLRCKLRPRDGQLVDDMEDLVMPMTPKIYVDGRRKTTGRMLYENLQALHTQHERMKARAACHGARPHAHMGSRECPNKVKSRLRIVPVNCLSMCHLGNVIAIAGPGKFGY
ncbi:hypothetical protein FBU31_001020, partial [Coemansia sp. 'formosensis']